MKKKKKKKDKKFNETDGREKKNNKIKPNI